MALKSFLILYPDGSKEHVSAKEREQLLLAGEIKKHDGNVYRYVVPPQRFTSFAELASLQPHVEHTNLRRFLPGQFVFELKKQRQHELMETPEAMAVRLELA